jgi:tRNA threonylcarbamoyladenosine biosynthesis protein TsaE
LSGTAPALESRAAWLAGEAATESLGAGLARALPVRPASPLVLALEGELGAGKTTLARALLRALGAQGAIKSPSYTLVEPYELPPWRVLHLDLYRLADPAELEALGVRDELLPGTLLLVEWPERGAGHLPTPDLQLCLVEPAAATAVSAGVPPEARQLTLRAATPAGRDWLERLLAHGSPEWQVTH